MRSLCEVIVIVLVIAAVGPGLYTNLMMIFNIYNAALYIQMTHMLKGHRMEEKDKEKNIKKKD